jgi:hypothetical protein
VAATDDGSVLSDNHVRAVAAGGAQHLYSCFGRSPVKFTKGLLPTKIARPAETTRRWPAVLGLL